MTRDHIAGFMKAVMLVRQIVGKIRLFKRMSLTRDHIAGFMEAVMLVRQIVGKIKIVQTNSVGAVTSAK